MSGPDDTRAQAGECDVAAIAARAAAYTAACSDLARVQTDDCAVLIADSEQAAMDRRDDTAHESAADVATLLRHIAAEPARVAAAVAGERARCVGELRDMAVDLDGTSASASDALCNAACELESDVAADAGVR